MCGGENSVTQLINGIKFFFCIFFIILITRILRQAIYVRCKADMLHKLTQENWMHKKNIFFFNIWSKYFRIGVLYLYYNKWIFTWIKRQGFINVKECHENDPAKTMHAADGNSIHVSLQQLGNLSFTQYRFWK